MKQKCKSNVLFKKWANPCLFLFIFVLFKHKFYRKNVGISVIQTRIFRYEGKHADHLTTTTALRASSLAFLGVKTP